MMNHHVPAGPGHQHMPPAGPLHPHHSQRRQDYHAFHGPPQSPIHSHPYAGQYHPQAPPQYYHPHPAQTQPYYPPRWQPQPQPAYPQSFVPQQPQMQHVPYPPRSPMVVSSQSALNGLPTTTAARQPTTASQHAPHHQQQQQQQQHRPESLQTSQSAQSISPCTPSSAQTPAPASELSTPAPSQSTRECSASSLATTQPQGEESTEPPQDPHPIAPTPERDLGAVNPLQLPAEKRTPYYPKLPWYSPSASPTAFPPRAIGRRKRRSSFHSANNAVALPSRVDTTGKLSHQTPTTEAHGHLKPAEDIPSETSTLAAPSEPETPATSHAPSESELTQVSTPTTPAQAPAASPKPRPTQAQQRSRQDTRTAVAVPFIPGLPKSRGTPPSTDRQQPPAHPSVETPIDHVAQNLPEDAKQQQQQQEAQTQPPKPAAPKSWADLVRTKDSSSSFIQLSGGASIANEVQSLPKGATLADALKQYIVQSDTLPFLEPRGLVNTGNMCYMNSILQVLVFCVPFYNFLDGVRTRTVHSMKSETPLIDAMIMFIRELPILVSADSVESLRKLLKSEKLEQYGEPITPEFVYDAIRHLPRFQSMRRGHQQDAEEFLGFLLEGLHDECLAVMQGNFNMQADPVNSPSVNSDQQDGDGWLEVGPKQKSAVTRTAGQQDAPSPITKIFGGHLRSELRVPGLKDSVTLEPYKPLQLDIGAPHINNIVDALKGLTRTENLTGDFGGRGNMAKKQVFIDSLPPVLILHLKRFQYDNNLTGTQKIWKKIGYPLDLEIPKEVFPPSKRGGLAVAGDLAKYRLISVVYHHGKSAAGGHYTVDVLRQDSREWVRIDDTVIRRIRPEDVAEGGSEEDPKILARALEQHKAAQDLQKQRNMYEGLDEDERGDEENARPWSEVNGHGAAEKKGKGSNGAAGIATPNSNADKKTPTAKREGVKDNKVAYILLYERKRT